jgi:hypothetical protein
LPPLLFILVIDQLSRMLQKAKDEKHIRGVYILGVDQEGLHCPYADNVSLIVGGNINYIGHLQGLFDSF